MLADIPEETTGSLEQKLIKEAYEATLDPARLAIFEKYWNQYINNKISTGTVENSIDDTSVNAHIATALDILERIRHVNETEKSAQTLVNSHYGFGFIIDNQGKILVNNTGADDLIRSHNSLFDIDIDNFSKTQIVSWIKSVRDGDAKPYKFFEVSLDTDDQLQCWFVCPIKITQNNGNNAPNYFLISSVEHNIRGQDSSIIGEFLGLSPAETDVAKLLCLGQSPKEIAITRCVKITAVRTQISSIKHKMSCKDIPAIVVKFMSMSLRKSAVQSQIDRMESILKPRLPGQSYEHRIILQDARQYQYFTQGHPKGRVILNIHSLINSVEFPRSANQALVMNGFKMISPVRAGYGKSDIKIYKNIYDRIDGCVSDFIELLDNLGIDEYSILTTWAGPFAQRLALKDSTRVKGVFLSGAVPLWDNTHLDYIDPRYANLIKASIHMPKILPYMIRLAKALIDSGRVKQYFSDLYEMNDSDRKALGNREIYDIVERRFNFWIEQGIQAFVSDVPSIHTNWEEDARRLEIPVTVLIGTEIKDQPPESIARYIKLVPQAQLVEIPGAGTYQELSHFSEILSEIARAS